MDKLYKYIYGNTRIYLAEIEEIAQTTKQIHKMNAKNIEISGKLEALAACFAGMQKDDEASIAVIAKYPVLKTSYCAIAEPDGRIRACTDQYDAEPKRRGVYLEVTRKLPIKGDYKGIVAAVTLNGAVKAYFTQSMQVDARYGLWKTPRGYACMIMEKLPGKANLSKPWQTVREAYEQQFCADSLTAIPDCRLLETNPLEYGCTCKKSAVMRIIRSMTPEEQQMAAIDGVITSTCKFCGKQYTYEI